MLREVRYTVVIRPAVQGECAIAAGQLRALSTELCSEVQDPGLRPLDVRDPALLIKRWPNSRPDDRLALAFRSNSELFSLQIVQVFEIHIPYGRKLPASTRAIRSPSNQSLDQAGISQPPCATNSGAQIVSHTEGGIVGNKRQNGPRERNSRFALTAMEP